MKKMTISILFLSFFQIPLFAKDVGIVSNNSTQQQIFVWRSFQFFSSSKESEIQYLNLLAITLSQLSDQNSDLKILLNRYGLLNNANGQVNLNDLSMLSYDERWDDFAEKVDSFCRNNTNSQCEKIQKIDAEINPSLRP